MKARGTYEARIACNLWAKGHETGRIDGKNPKKRLEAHPYFTQTGKDREENGDQYIANMRDGATAGFKYFVFDGTETMISVTGRGTGKFIVSTDPDGKEIVAAIPVNGAGACNIPEGTQALYFRYAGTDAADFISFTIE